LSDNTTTSATVEVKEKEPESVDQIKDSEEVKKTIEKYGPKYFQNPRRLKRFINGFRLHVYLTNKSKKKFSTDTLARFLVLTEKWPGVVEYFYGQPRLLLLWLMTQLAHTEMVKEEFEEAKGLDSNVEKLLSSDKKIASLFLGPDPENDSINGDLLKELCDWYGFQYYKPGGPEKTNDKVQATD